MTDFAPGPILRRLAGLFAAGLILCGCVSAPPTVDTPPVAVTSPPAAPATAPPAAERPTETAAPARISVATPTPPPESPVASPTPTPARAGLYVYKVINTYPHDRDAFTQGLIYLDDIFYEGTGLYGRSTLRKVAVDSGEVLQKIDLSPDLFGEGITVLGDNLYQLTWKSGRGFVYDKNTFELKREFAYPTEGWGITHDGERLIVSDGSDTLYFWDPNTLAEIGRVQVFDAQLGPVARLNELEYINGEVFANIWQTDFIARINPQTGQVVGWINLQGLLSAEDRTEPVDVLNGIAYDAGTDRLFITGKLWPKIFEIEPVPFEN